MPIYGNNLSQYGKIRDCIQAIFTLWYIPWNDLNTVKLFFMIRVRSYGNSTAMKRGNKTVRKLYCIVSKLACVKNNYFSFT